VAADVNAPRTRFGSLRRGSAEASREDVATRVSAYVYGNVLVMAALIALHPDDLQRTTGLVYVLGVGISTFVAHTLGEAVGCGSARPARSTRRTSATRSTVRCRS